MVIVTAYRAGGYDPEQANGNAAQWFDTTARKAYSADAAGTVTARDFNADENAVADALERPGHQSEQSNTLRQQLLAGIATLEAAQQQCADDHATALTKQTQAAATASAMTSRAAAIRAIAAPTNAQIKEELALIREDLATVATAVAEVYGWRAVLDSGLSLSYSSTVGLARIEVNDLEG